MKVSNTKLCQEYCRDRPPVQAGAGCPEVDDDRRWLPRHSAPSAGRSPAAAAPAVSEYFADAYSNIIRISRECRFVLCGSGRAGALTMYRDIVVTRRTVGLTLAGMLTSLLLVGAVIVCAVRGFVVFC